MLTSRSLNETLYEVRIHIGAMYRSASLEQSFIDHVASQLNDVNRRRVIEVKFERVYEYAEDLRGNCTQLISSTNWF